MESDTMGKVLVKARIENLNDLYEVSQGRLKLDQWEKEGQKHSKLKVIGERMQMDRDVVDGGVVGQVRLQAGIDHMGADRHTQGIAVGLCSDRCLRADISGGSTSVVDNDRLPHSHRERISERTSLNVGGPASGEWHDDPYRLRWISLASCGNHAERQSCGCYGE